MTNLKTISSLVSFYTVGLQKHKSTINFKQLDSHFHEDGNHHKPTACNKRDFQLRLRMTSISDLEEESLQYIKNDVQAIVCEVLDVDKTYLYMHSDRKLEAIHLIEIDNKITRYRRGEPLAHILGYKYFWNQKLKVTADTLIPRADTEVLVQTVLDDIFRANYCYKGKGLPSLTAQLIPSYDRGEGVELSILDLGTGTGAIALALAGELPNTKIVAVDYCVKALEVASENAISNSISNVEFLQSHWYKNLEGRKFDVIVSNPPYIDRDDNDIDAEVKVHEPASALFADNSGLADIEVIISQAEAFLIKNGSLYIEHGYNQSREVQEIFAKYGFESTETIRDLNSKDRCTRATKK